MHLPARRQSAQFDNGRHRRCRGNRQALFAAFQRFEYDFVLAILISIIAVVLIGELASENYVKRISMSESFGPVAAGVWQRHTLGQKLARTALWLVIGVAVMLSLQSINVIWGVSLGCTGADDGHGASHCGRPILPIIRRRFTLR